MRYPLPKYDQVCVPEFNAGAMENFGCVVHAEQYYIFRSQVTDYEYEQPRQHDPARDGAHVVRRPGHHALVGRPVAERVVRRVGQRTGPTTEATRFTDAWTTFLSIRKTWGYRQDQLSSTHPVYCEMPGRGGGRGQLRRHHVRQGRQRDQAARRVRRDRRRSSPACGPTSPRHAWGNATFADLLSALEEASGRQATRVRRAVAGDRAGQHAAPGGRHRRRRHLHSRSRCARRRRPATRPCAPTASASASTTCDGDRLVRRDQLGARRHRRAHPESTRSPASGRPTCCCSTTTTSPTPSCASTTGRWPPWSATSAGFDNSLARALCWARGVGHGPRRRAGRPRLRRPGLLRPARRDRHQPGHRRLRQAQAALAQYADPAWAPTGLGSC